MKRLSLCFLFLLGFFHPATSQPEADALQQKILFARDKVMPALVHVEPVKSFFTTGEKRHTLVTGSGFIFSRDGYILTNHHVVENAEKVFCTLFNKKKLSARVVGSDPSTDVAVLQLNMEEWGKQPLPSVRLGNSDSVEVGQIVLALGSPLGLSRSVSMGVISSIDRYFEDQGEMISPYNLWIQTDAAINPGNSGGPLINLDGEVVGINARGVFLAENLGFAIPINLAKEVAEKLLGGEKIERSWIGVELQPVKDLREYLNRPDLQGVLISHVEPFSPAEKAGLKPGDVITNLNGLPIHADYEEDLPAIRKIIADIPNNREIELTIWRAGKKFTRTLITRPEPFPHVPEFECPDWGIVVKSLTRNIFKLQALPDYHGVYISAVKSGGPGEQAKLQAGDVIRAINHRKVTDMAAFKTLYRELSEKKPKVIFCEVYREGTPYFAVIEIREKLQESNKPELIINRKDARTR